MVLFPGGRAVASERIVPRRADHGAAELDIDHVAILIHKRPQILLLAIDSNEDFVQVPNIAGPDTASGFGHSHSYETMIPTFGEKILDLPEAQAETMVSPDGIADGFWRETMTVIARPVVLHGTRGSVRRPT